MKKIGFLLFALSVFSGCHQLTATSPTSRRMEAGLRQNIELTAPMPLSLGFQEIFIRVPSVRYHNTHITMVGPSEPLTIRAEIHGANRAALFNFPSQVDVTYPETGHTVVTATSTCNAEYFQGASQRRGWSVQEGACVHSLHFKVPRKFRGRIWINERVLILSS